MVVNLPAVEYWGLLRAVSVLVGNSSSGIMEAASFGIPAVNIGIRQRGREHGANVLNVPAEVGAISGAMAKAMEPEFRESLRGMQNPYGDGQASEKIVEILRTVPLGEELLLKRHLLG